MKIMEVNLALVLNGADDEKKVADELNQIIGDFLNDTDHDGTSSVNVLEVKPRAKGKLVRVK